MIFDIHIMKAAAKNSLITKFTVVPPAIWIIQILVTSFFTMFFFALLADYIGNPEVTVTYVVIGNAVQSIAATTLYSVAEIPGIEKHTGTLGSLVQSPSPLFTIFLGMSVINIITGMIAMSVSLCFAAFVFGVSFASCNFVSVIIIMILTCLSLAGMGMMIGSIGIHLRTSAIIANVVAYIGLLLCGVNFPMSYLPDWVQSVAHLLPLTYAVEATRDAVNGSSLADIGMPLLIMVVLGAIFLIFAWYSFGYFEEKARTKGTIDSF